MSGSVRGAMGLAPYLFLLLCCLAGVRSEVVLTQPASVVQKPGASVTLTCKTKGFSLSSNWMHWVKQESGKGLQWVSVVTSTGSKYYASGFQGRFTVSKDSNTVYLEINSLSVKDTATYYCTRDTARGTGAGPLSVDYWGKGTSLTVASEVESLPSVFIAPPCHREADQEISLLCLVKDYQPESIIQTWSTSSGDITTGFKKYPAVLGQNAKYTMSSLLRVPAVEWKSNNVYSCKAGYKPDKFVKEDYMKPQSPKLTPLAPTPKILSNQTNTILGCMISQFTPDRIRVTWKKAGSEQLSSLLPSKRRPDGAFETVTYLTVSVDEWTSKQEYTCEVIHTPSNFHQKITMTYQGELFVSIQNPSIKEIWINKTATLVCTVISADPSKVFIAWEVNGEDRSDKAVTYQPTKEGFQNTKISRLQTSVEEWSSGIEYTCSAQDPLSSAVSARTKSTKVETKPPEVRLLPPPYEGSKRRKTATLECVVSEFYPDHIDVTWKKGRSLISSNTSSTRTALEQAGTFSASHFLTVSSQEWKAGSVFSCTVSHPSSNTSITKEARNTQEDCPDTHLSVTLRKPSFHEIWTNRTATILCEVVRGNLDGFRVTWQVHGSKREDGVRTQGPIRDGDEDTIISRLVVPATEWEIGTEYLCIVEDKSLPTPEKRSIKKATGGVVTSPHIYLLPPSSDEFEADQSATLMCLVNKFSPADIYVAWMANDTLLKTGYVNHPVTEDTRRDWNTMTSQLKISLEEWNRGTTFSCVVGHESLTTNLFRSINKSHGKPSLVNLSLVLTDSFTSCGSY
ncbi:immunoglobulin gamma-1 heavy chain-like [Narcine bancroftii]|uniref:immunoglobulin gamma-1 heavy chain-like n=1 Tax=Narcine bancroftii TaxID=1343680 RepID=UPI003831D74F